MHQPTITSRLNPKVKYLDSLKDKKARYQANTFLVEGYRELTRVLMGKKELLEVYICPELAKPKTNFQELYNQLENNNIPIFTVNQSVFEKLSYRDNPDGFLGLVRMWPLLLDTLPLSPNPYLLLAEGIEKPGNLGALMRSAEGAGVDGLIICNSIVDIFNPNTIRSSQGALFSTPIAVCDNHQANQFLDNHSIQKIITTPHAKKMYWDINYQKATAIIIGNEDKGLSDYWLDQGDPVQIPMRGISDSLNVNIAAVICLYEGVRQRSFNP